MKHDDGAVFGPIAFDVLRQWAQEAQISPLDKISPDEKSWTKAPMLPELEMDYIVEVSPDQFYGPTTIGAVLEFWKAGEIREETVVTNCKDGSELPLREVTELRKPAQEDAVPPVRTSIRVSLQERIRELEKHLLDERRARDAAELRCEKLEAKLAELSAKTY